MWYKGVLAALRASGLFRAVELQGAKVRAVLDEARFLDIHYDPTTGSYSYALIDLRLPYAGDKRVCGWDDCPHEGVGEIRALPSYPHHYQRRATDGRWVYEASPMRGDIGHDATVVLEVIRALWAL